mgnify:CR=1 FL=1
MSFFHNINTLQDLRKEYHRLALVHHPDRGGDLETMKAINNEFERLSKKLINNEPTFTESRKAYETQVSEEIMEVIQQVLNLVGIDIEIIGSWVWLTGNTYANREAIKNAGFSFSHQKTAWYWHAGDYRKKNGKMSSLDAVRAFWGSEKIQPKHQDEKILA